MYTQHRDSLSQTGQGLVASDKEDEIQPGSELANVWGELSSLYFVRSSDALQIKYRKNFLGTSAWTDCFVLVLS